MIPPNHRQQLRPLIRRDQPKRHHTIPDIKQTLRPSDRQRRHPEVSRQSAPKRISPVPLSPRSTPQSTRPDHPRPQTAPINKPDPPPSARRCRTRSEKSQLLERLPPGQTRKTLQIPRFASTNPTVRFSNRKQRSSVRNIHRRRRRGRIIDRARIFFRPERSRL
jgi:hypothetical protein